MIYQVLDRDKVTELKDQLKKELPGSAKIFYVLKNYLQGLLEGFEVIVDLLPNWTCIILRPTKEGVLPAYFQHMYVCHARSVSALKFFIQRPGVVDWRRPAIFTGAPCDLATPLQELSRKHGGHIRSVEPRFMYAWTKKEPPPPPRVPEGVTLTSLQPRHAQILRQDWKHARADADLETYFRRVIENFESSAAVGEDGELLAYICMQFNGSMAMMHVREEQRGRGLGQLVVCDLTRKLLARDEIAFGFVPATDSGLIGVAQTSGFTWVPQGNMSWVSYLPHPPERPQGCGLAASPSRRAAAAAGDEGVAGGGGGNNHVLINAVSLVCKDVVVDLALDFSNKVGIS